MGRLAGSASLHATGVRPRLTGLMDAWNRFSFLNRGVKETMQETCSQTGFAPCDKSQIGLKQDFQNVLISNRFAQPNRFGVTNLFLDQTGSDDKPL